MVRIIACIDGSAYADSVCFLSAWASGRSGLDISLLHVIVPRLGTSANGDMSGQIGLGANGILLEELAKLDEDCGRLEQRKGQLVLAHAQEVLKSENRNPPEVLHRRGSLVEVLAELGSDGDIVVMGKRGEHYNAAPGHLGSNLERVARAIDCPLLVASAKPRPISRFLIAYDGSAASNKVIDFSINNSLLKGLECHLLNVGIVSAETESPIRGAEEKLRAAGYSPHVSIRQGKPVEAIVCEYISNNGIDLLAIGAYGHSKLRNLILGSTTTSLIRKSDVALLLVR
jgi:nucleotide-binding universal stress UspA family protein